MASRVGRRHRGDLGAGAERVQGEHGEQDAQGAVQEKTCRKSTTRTIGASGLTVAVMPTSSSSREHANTEKE
ncbi:hypothetical protein [Streptomyces fulvoviolaceus]|uniref:hypothetical protein n=1 Tax=Streptomyces fulvoviolaceus TaxID=285535 RepID=UPI0004CA5171|nr:hypothetical protein [Streptomyces fulvoviolaceus]MCT9082712.1 hypothetical protein [Streptomyces fulvoviolaceus]